MTFVCIFIAILAFFIGRGFRGDIVGELMRINETLENMIYSLDGLACIMDRITKESSESKEKE